MFMQTSYLLPVALNLAFILAYIALYHVYEPVRTVIQKVFKKHTYDVCFFLIFGAFIPFANMFLTLAFFAFWLYLLFTIDEAW